MTKAEKSFLALFLLVLFFCSIESVHGSHEGSVAERKQSPSKQKTRPSEISGDSTGKLKQQADDVADFKQGADFVTDILGGKLRAPWGVALQTASTSIFTGANCNVFFRLNVEAARLYNVSCIPVAQAAAELRGRLVKGKNLPEAEKTEISGWADRTNDFSKTCAQVHRQMADHCKLPTNLTRTEAFVSNLPLINAAVANLTQNENNNLGKYCAEKASDCSKLLPAYVDWFNNSDVRKTLLERSKNVVTIHPFRDACERSSKMSDRLWNLMTSYGEGKTNHMQSLVTSKMSSKLRTREVRDALNAMFTDQGQSNAFYQNKKNWPRLPGKEATIPSAPASNWTLNELRIFLLHVHHNPCDSYYTPEQRRLHELYADSTIPPRMVRQLTIIDEAIVAAEVAERERRALLPKR